MLPAQSEHISIVPLPEAGEKLLFRVYNHAAPFGYARLKKIHTRNRSANSKDMFDREGIEAHEPRMREISQNHRQQGVGSNLLKEIIRYFLAWPRDATSSNMSVPSFLLP